MAMKRLVTGMPLVGVLLLLLFSFSASARTAVSAKSKPPALRTVVATYGTIYAFAQDGDAIAWIGGDARVRVRRLSTGKSSVVGKIQPQERGRTAVLALAGTRALWSWDSGGNSTEYPIVSGAPGQRPVEIVRLGRGLRGMGDGLDPTGLAGDGATLAYGWVAEVCPGWPLGGCEAFTQPLVVAGGGVSLADAPVTALPHIPPVIPHIPPPALFAASDREVATVAARSPSPIGQWVPRVTEDGPVEVCDLSGTLLLRAEMVGIVRDVALSGRRLAVLVEVPDGRMRLEEFTIPNPAFVTGAAVPRTAADVSVSSAGIVYRVGTRIFVLSTDGAPRLACKASGTPIGLSIEGRRIAWAENVKGRGRVVALTVH
jgi:hypothetical protein